MTTAQHIANIINDSTASTGMTASVVDGKCFVHVPFQSSAHGRGYEQVKVSTEQFAHSLVRSMK